jgi:chromatin-remodeling ATPase INO80
MSFASILSEPADEMPPRRVSPAAPAPSQPVSLSKKPELAPVMPLPRLEKKPSLEKRMVTLDRDESPFSFSLKNEITKAVAKPVAQARPAPVKAPRLTQKDFEAMERSLAEIDRAEKSDVEDESGFEAELQLFIARSKKRAMEADLLESHKCKVCFVIFTLYYHLTDFVWLIYYRNFSAVATSSF